MHELARGQGADRAHEDPRDATRRPVLNRRDRLCPEAHRRAAWRLGAPAEHRDPSGADGWVAMPFPTRSARGSPRKASRSVEGPSTAARRRPWSSAAGHHGHGKGRSRHSGAKATAPRNTNGSEAVRGRGLEPRWMLSTSTSISRESPSLLKSNEKVKRSHFPGATPASIFPFGLA